MKKKGECLNLRSSTKYVDDQIVSVIPNKLASLLLFSVLILRVDRFTQALIAWGQEQLEVSKPTIFDQAFPFLGLRQIQASRSRADTRRVPEEKRSPTSTHRPPSPAVYPPADVMGKADTQAEAATSRWEEGKEAEKDEGTRKRRKTGALLRLDESVVVRKAREAFFLSMFVCRGPTVAYVLY